MFIMNLFSPIHKPVEYIYAYQGQPCKIDLVHRIVRHYYFCILIHPVLKYFPAFSVGYWVCQVVGCRIEPTRVHRPDVCQCHIVCLFSPVIFIIYNFHSNEFTRRCCSVTKCAKNSKGVQHAKLSYGSRD